MLIARWITALAVPGKGIIFRTQGYQYGGSNLLQWTYNELIKQEWMNLTPENPCDGTLFG